MYLMPILNSISAFGISSSAILQIPPGNFLEFETPVPISKYSGIIRGITIYTLHRAIASSVAVVPAATLAGDGDRIPKSFVHEGVDDWVHTIIDEVQVVNGIVVGNKVVRHQEYGKMCQDKNHRNHHHHLQSNIKM